MCSGVGLVMVAVVGAAVLMRRGWRPAPDTSFRRRRATRSGSSPSVTATTPSGTSTRLRSHGSCRRGSVARSGALGPSAAFGAVFGIVLVAGLVLARTQHPAGRRSDLAAGRVARRRIRAAGDHGGEQPGFGADWARQSRYVSLVAAMTPAGAGGCRRLTRETMALVPTDRGSDVPPRHSRQPACGNARTEDVASPRRGDTIHHAVAPRDPLARTVPRAVRPELPRPFPSRSGGSLDGEAHGKPRRAVPLTPELKSSNQFRLSFVTTKRADARRELPFHAPRIVMNLRRGERVGIYDGGVFLEPFSRP